MKPKGCHNYFIYILTNANKTVLYTGVTNNIGRRLLEHNSNPANGKISFTVKYNCFYLIYFEHFSNINHAIEREKQIKGWSRKKKEDLINSFNPEWKFLNDEVQEIYISFNIIQLKLDPYFGFFTALRFVLNDKSTNVIQSVSEESILETGIIYYNVGMRV